MAGAETQEDDLNRLYEGMFVFDANLAGKDWPGLEKHVEDLLRRHRGEIVHSERWPDRKLAYEMKGCKKGTYFLTYFNAPADEIPGLHRDVEISDRVLRLLVLQNETIEDQCRQRQEKAAEAAANREAASEEAPATDAPAADVTPKETPAPASEPQPSA